MTVIRTLICAAACAALPGFAAAAEATAGLADGDGNPVGSVTFSDTPSGLVLVTVSVEGVPSGVHGIHIHETGDCTAPDFESAGDHLALGHEHGVMVEAGPHPGDLPNLHVGEEGTLTVESFTDRISLDPADEDTLLDEDGSAVIVHVGADDYHSQPTGDAGDRLACGVIEPAVETE
jgi:superoxide dismutase, Cu-Zn family